MLRVLKRAGGKVLSRIQVSNLNPLKDFCGGRCPPYGTYDFDYRIPSDGEGLRLITEVAYHIMSERTHGKLEKKYGLTARVPYRSVIFRETIPLKGR